MILFSTQATLRSRFTALRSGRLTRAIRLGAQLAPRPNLPLVSLRHIIQLANIAYARTLDEINFYPL